MSRSRLMRELVVSAPADVINFHLRPVSDPKAAKTLARRYAVLTTFMAYVTLPAHKINVPPPASRYSTRLPD
ncbi:unnamed protein product, partial [Brenthis ino]